MKKPALCKQISNFFISLFIYNHAIYTAPYFIMYTVLRTLANTKGCYTFSGFSCLNWLFFYLFGGTAQYNTESETMKFEIEWWTDKIELQLTCTTTWEKQTQTFLVCTACWSEKKENCVKFGHWAINKSNKSFLVYYLLKLCQ